MQLGVGSGVVGQICASWGGFWVQTGHSTAQHGAVAIGWRANVVGTVGCPECNV